MISNVIKKKGFTLIELLAVIIILGVIMIIAIPSVTSYISKSRKDSYISTAKQIVKGAIPIVNSGDLDIYDMDTTYYLPAKCIPTENSGRSPFGEFEKAYVVVIYTSEGFQYYWTSLDTTKHGIVLKDFNMLKRDDIKTGIEDIDINLGVGDRVIIRMLSEDDCKTFSEPTEVNNVVNDDGEVVDVGTQGVKIYWALQDNNHDNKNETLIISTAEVTGALNGNFHKNTSFGQNASSIPWISTNQVLQDQNLSKDVTNVRIVGAVAPKDLSYWFSGVGAKASTVTFDIANLNVSNVDSFLNTFMSAGYRSTTFNLDLSSWNAKKVKTMEGMFNNAGKEATTFSVTLGNWNESKSTSFNLMFSHAGENATSWTVNNIDKLNTSHTTNMSDMFSWTGMNAANYNLDFSSFDMSKVSEMNNMIYYAGRNASSWKITIPKKSGVNNTTSRFYGKSNQVYVDSTSAKAGSHFTLSK